MISLPLHLYIFSNKFFMFICTFIHHSFIHQSFIPLTNIYKSFIFPIFTRYLLYFWHCTWFIKREYVHVAFDLNVFLEDAFFFIFYISDASIVAHTYLPTSLLIFAHYSILYMPGHSLVLIDGHLHCFLCVCNYNNVVVNILVDVSLQACANIL